MLMIWSVKVLNLSKIWAKYLSEIWAKSDSDSSKMLMIWSMKVLNLSKISELSVDDLICQSIKFERDLS